MTSHGKVYSPFLMVTSFWHGTTQSKVTSSAGLPWKRSYGKKIVTFFKGPNTFFIFLTRFPRNKSALRDKATKPSATKDECTGAMAQRHRPCIWTGCSRSVLPFTVPLIPTDKTPGGGSTRPSALLLLHCFIGAEVYPS